MTDTRVATVVAGLASVGAGLVHLAVTPAHWQEWTPSGVFFIGIALFQLLWAGAVLWLPRSGVVGPGAAVNLGAMALWGQSVVWGVPAGPNAWVPEAVDVAGVTAVLLESVTVVSALWFLLPRERTAVLSTGGYRFALGGAALVVVTLVTPGIAAGLGLGGSGHEHGPGGSHHEPGTNHRGTSAPSDSTAGTPTPTRSGPISPSPRSPQPGEPSSEHDTSHDHSH